MRRKSSSRQNMRSITFRPLGVLVIAMGMFTSWVRRYHGLDLMPGELVAQAFGIVGSVSQETPPPGIENCLFQAIFVSKYMIFFTKSQFCRTILFFRLTLQLVFLFQATHDNLQPRTSIWRA
jgi:hypothetical protein